MKTPGLTREQVSSHLQRFRLKNHALFSKSPSELTFQDETTKIIKSVTLGHSDEEQEQPDCISIPTDSSDCQQTTPTSPDSETECNTSESETESDSLTRGSPLLVVESCESLHRMDNSYYLPPFDCNSVEFIESMHQLVDYLFLQQSIS
eukprot:TRINITY_DN269_c0_g1_i2.p1 TRINITY_DN269_c0_g1~~TRINITY_DN269_c0_g1_i2.p1  ORF type:complete len:149 (+),score=20.88 TRINITY_DN269_c0_g1_i2:107-553(+)